MTQFQFDLICKIIDTGAPVLAEELCGALNTLVQSFNSTIVENETLKAQLDAVKAISEETAESVAESAAE
jgi:hypothetical protein